ncbi:tRNA (guanosine(37)-N1)-methyltransferase TrmD [Patescibacteria group bacterium]|nr:tRNA (guanosine(37)-N1)-methyltransferase TrmD [Patescibacteria group bacterium]MBU2036120.1 tRNA (guanosine(37)-N1)-methyltransferase TrmD [Patescibacteria group bacterium]
MLKIDIITLFPSMFKGPFDESIVKRAQDKKLVEINIHDLREYGFGERRTVDDRPYGGGIGMILMVEPIYKVLKRVKTKDSRVILLTPRGKTFNQENALKLSQSKHLIFIAGHYEGYDERITEFVDEEISIGNFILTGGEIPTMIIVDSIVRLIPKVLEKEDATKFESFSEENKLEYPQYTRPEEFKGLKVPKVLLSGNHKEISDWREQKSKEKTIKINSEN